MSTELRNVRCSFTNAPSVTRGSQYTFDGVAALVILDTTDSKGRPADYVAPDAMSSVYLAPGSIEFPTV